jgi:hypothetical protein
LNYPNTGQLPASRDAEDAVLGSLMVAPETLTNVNLDESDFFFHDNRLIFAAIKARAEKNLPFDSVTLADDFQGNERVSMDHLVELSTTFPSAANIDGYAAIVRDKSVRRQLIEAATQLEAKARNCAEPADTIADTMAALAMSASRVTEEKQEPLDLFGDLSLPPLNPDWLPPGIAKYAYDQARIIGCAPEMVAFSCIATIAAATHDGIVVKPKANEAWTERACLWLMVVAPPGSKKSVAVKRPQGPLRKIDAQLCSEYLQQRASFDNDDKVYQLQQREAVKRQAKGEGYDEPITPPKRPPNTRAIINDATVEKMGELLVDNPRGLLLYQDEIAVWFGGHDAYAKNGGGKDRGMAIQAYEGGSYTFDRIGRGTVSVPNWSYSLIGTTQPEKIKEITSRMSDDGLLQRFMVIEVPRQVIHGDEDTQEDVAARNAYEEAIANIWARVPGDGMKCAVSLSPEADAVRRDFTRWVDRVSNAEGLPAMLTGHLSKWAGLWPRLCLTYHSLGTALGGQWPSDMPISGVTARRVTALMKQYLLPQALRFYTDTTSNSDLTYSIAQRAASMILAKGMIRLANRDMMNAVLAWKNATPFQQQAVISMLRGAGWLLGADTKRSTGAETAWAVNPRVHVLYGERAAIEKAKRQQGAEIMRELKESATGRAG